MLHLQYSQKDVNDDELQNVLKVETNQVRHLYLDMNRISSIGMMQLSLRSWSNLEHILLNNNSIGNLGWKQFSKMSIPKLKSINLSFTEAGDQGLHYLAKADFRNLKQMHIGGNHLRRTNSLIKNNFKKMEWVSLNPGTDTTASLNVFEAERMFIVQWSGAKCIFFPKKGVDQYSTEEFLKRGKSCFGEECRLYFC